jgi:hypothetical protein
MAFGSRPERMNRNVICDELFFEKREKIAGIFLTQVLIEETFSTYCYSRHTVTVKPAGAVRVMPNENPLSVEANPSCTEMDDVSIVLPTDCLPANHEGNRTETAQNLLMQAEPSHIIIPSLL